MRRVIVSVLVALTAVVTWSVATPTPAFAAGESWVPRTTPQSAWRSVAGKGTSNVYVAVANSGADRIMRSTDGGDSWEAITAPVVGSWSSVTYGDPADPFFVAVASDDGSSRSMKSTDDGATWGSNPTPAGEWKSVTYDPDNDKFLAVAADGTNRVMTSASGSSWSAVPNAVADAGVWKSVAYGHLDDTYVAVGDGGKIMYSTDAGASWTLATTPGGQTANNWTAVAYEDDTVDSRFVAVSANGTDRAAYSNDGVTWNASGDGLDTDNGAWASVAWDGAKFAAVGTGTNRVMTSGDGAAWTLESTTNDSTIYNQNIQWTAVGTDSGYFVAVAASGVQRTMRSPEGTTWTSHPAPFNAWTSVAFGDGLFVAVAQSGTINRVMTSPDGVTWAAHAAAEANVWKSVVYGPADDRFVAVAADGNNQVMTSDNGTDWSPAIAAADQTWLSVTYGEGRFVAVSPDGTDRVMTSTDGVNWTLVVDSDTDDGEWRSVTYGNGTFVAVADNRFMSSPDGIAWTSGAPPNANAWSSVTYGGTLFVAVARGGDANTWAMTSANGSAWTASTDTDTDSAFWTSVTYGDLTYVAVADGGGTNRVMNSTNGTAWTPQNDADALTGDWSSVAYSSGIFVAVAPDGTNRIMTSGTFTPPVDAPTITSFDPTEGPVGTTVTITGTNLTGATALTIDGVEVTDFDVVSATEITAVIPDGATTGPFEVTTPGGSAVSDDDFTVTVVPQAIRIWGQDELDTAIKVSQNEFPDDGTASAVVLTRSDWFADALAGGPLAAAVDGPLLLTHGAPTAGGGSLPDKVLDEIDRVIDTSDPVYVLGGDDAVSPGVESDLVDAGYTVVRVAGDTQFGTAVEIADTIGSPSAILEATGWNFPDALSAVPAAINIDGVILLTNNNVQAPETQAYIDAHPSVPRYTIGGGFVAGGADPDATNVSGPTLYDTSAKVADRWFPDPDEFGVATGNNFPDALAGGVFMATGDRMGPMLLVNGRSTPVPPSIVAYLNDLDPGTTGYAFGGTIAISTAVLNAVMAAVGA